MNEIIELQNEVKQFAGTIPTTIQTPAELAHAEGLFVAIRKKRKEVEKFFDEKFIQPAKKLLDGHKAEAKLAIQPLIDAEAVLDKASAEYRKAERERLAKEQAKLLAQHEKKVEKAIAKGKDPDEVAPPVLVVAQQKSTDTGEGKLTYRMVKKPVCVDESLTPDAYMIITKTPNKRMIEAALRGGQVVPGWMLEEVEEKSVRAAS